MTEQHQQPNINLNPDPATFQGHLRGNTLIPGAVLTALPINVESLTDPLIIHAAGSAFVSFATAGRVIVNYFVSIGNALNAPSQSSTTLFFNSGAGFVAVTGPIAWAIHPSIATGVTTVSATHELNVSGGDAIVVASLRVGGAGALFFVSVSCELLIEFYPDI